MSWDNELLSVLYQVDGPLARITLNRQEKRNALNSEMIVGLRAALAASADAPGVRVVLLSGAGSDFCSGADLREVLKVMDAGPLENMADARTLADLFLQMRHHPRPIVAAVRGRALAGGCGLATAADVILASETAQFGYPEVNIGFVPAMVMAILRRSVSEKRAFDLITMGEILNAQTAYEVGLITRVLAEETFDLEVEAYASKLASKPASAVALSKELLYQIDAMSFEAALQSGVQANVIARMMPECRQGMEKFLKKQEQKP
jgi:methylglutaconyl-CoA hydratase